MNEMLKIEERSLSQSWDTPDSITLIRKLIAPTVSDLDFDLFLQIARSSRLNPLQRQIYAISRQVWNPETRTKDPKMTIVTGIDGYRALASDTGFLLGIEAPVFEIPDDGSRYPISASVTVLKSVGDKIGKFTAICYWDEYAPYYEDKKTGSKSISGMWDKMPRTMLGKVAEALALRKGFSTTLSGIYTQEELDQSQPSIPKQDDGSYTYDSKPEKVNKDFTESKIDKLREAQEIQKKNKMDELIAKGIDMAYQGLETLNLWAKNDLSKEEQDIIRGQWHYIKSKCPSDDLNQDIQE